MRVVLAPDKFKDSLTAGEVAASLAAGLRGARPDLVVDLVPVADGGEGTVDAARAAGWSARAVTVRGPLGDPVTAAYAVAEGTALVEMAAASGLGVLPVRDGARQRDAVRASSYGTGELVLAALDEGCTTIVLAVGGSATTDGGAGLLAALGALLLDDRDRPLPPGGGSLAELSRVDLGTLDPRVAATRFVLAADVTNPLCGPSGAAAVFGPQKGATPEQVELLDVALSRYAALLAQALGPSAARAATAPGAGAAGGVGFAALAVLGAERRDGIDVVLDLVGLDERLPGATAVVTGEGSFDEQSLGGKAPVGVARRARAHGVPTVVAVCGRTALAEPTWRAAGFDHVWPLSELEPDPVRSIAGAAALLESLGARLARVLG